MRLVPIVRMPRPLTMPVHDVSETPSIMKDMNAERHIRLTARRVFHNEVADCWMARKIPDLGDATPNEVIDSGDPDRMLILLEEINADAKKQLLHTAYTVMQPDAAQRWIRSPNPGLGGTAPADSEMIFGRYRAAKGLLLALGEGVTT